MARYEVTTESGVYEVDTLEKPKPSLYSEVGAPFAHALSLIAGDIPKAIGSRDISPEGQEAYRTLYPEQQTGLGKTLRFATNVPAFAVGLPGKAALGAGKILTAGAEQATKYIPKFAGKSLAGRTALRTGEFGASQAAIAPKEGEDYARQVGTAAAIGAGTPAAGLLAKSIGKSAVGTGTFVAKTFGGVTDFSRETIKRLGSARVFDPLKQSAGYIGEVVVPKVKNIISQKITDGKDRITLRNIGVNDEQINWLAQLSPIYKDRLLKVLNGENVNIKQGIEAIKGDAHKRFSALMSRVNPNTAIDVKTFYNNLKNTLVKQGWVDRTGQEVVKYGRNPVRGQLLSIYNNLTRSVRTETGGYRKYVLNIPEYENVRNALTTAVSGNLQNDRLLFELGGKLRESAANTIKGLSGVNKLYSDAERLAEIEGKGLFSKILNSEKMEAEIAKLRNIDKPNQIARIKSVIGKDLADDVDAHLAVMDLGLVTQRPGVSGGMFPGPSGVKRALLSGATQKYYRDIYPKTQKVKGLYEALRSGGKNIYNKPLFGQPILLNRANKDFLLRQAGNERGSAYIGGGPPRQAPQGKQGIVEGKPLTAAEAVKGKYVTVYHRTNISPEDIGKTGFKSLENTDEIFLSNKKEGQAVGYGKNVIELKVKKSDLRLDDEFPDGEKHFALSSKKATQYLREQAQPLTAQQAVKQGMGAPRQNPLRNKSGQAFIGGGQEISSPAPQGNPQFKQGKFGQSDILTFSNIRKVPGLQQLLQYPNGRWYWHGSGIPKEVQGKIFDTKELAQQANKQGIAGGSFGILGPTMATGAGLAAALKATAAKGETGESLDPKYKQQIANAENYGKTEGDWAQIEDIVIRDLKRIGKLKQNITLKQVKADPQLYDKVAKLYWDRLDAFGIPDKDKALWWLMPGRYRQTGGDISRLKNPEHRNIMRNRIKNIGGG